MHIIENEHEMKQEEVSALMVLSKWNVEKVKIFVEKMMEKVAKLTNPTPYHDDFQKKNHIKTSSKYAHLYFCLKQNKIITF